MRVRVTGLWKHPKTGIYWLRMAVPERHRAAVGKREIKETYRTRNEAEALLKHAPRLAQVLQLFTRLDTELADKVGDEAVRITQRGFEALARRNLAGRDDGVTTLADAETNVVLGMLTVLSFRVRCTWGRDHAWRAEQELLGEVSDAAISGSLPVGILDANEQAAVAAKIGTLEGKFVDVLVGDPERAAKAMCGNPRTQGMAYREIALALLKRGDLAFADMEVMLVAEAADVVVTPGTRLYMAVAEKVLTKLAHHRPIAWIMAPPATEFITTARSEAALPAKAPSETSPNSSPHTLDDAFKAWCKQHRIDPTKPHKTADEWRTAMRRFADLHGAIPLNQITRGMVLEFRDVLFELPSRPKQAIKALPLKKQVEIAASEQLPLLSPNTIEKQICAIRSLLQVALDKPWGVTSNAASNVRVAGAGYVGDERDYFTSDEMALIFSSRLATDPDACSDTMFYLLVLASLQGGRPGEFCKLKPDEIRYDGGIPILRVRRKGGRSQKTDGSVRDVPVHWIACEAGIMELAEIRRQQGAEWLFDDLVPDKYGDRYKYMSRKMNQALRALGIAAEDKCFYSTRHTSKRESRKQRVTEQNADAIHGQSSPNVGRRYGKGVPAEVLKDDIDALVFDSVDWDSVAACGHARIKRLREGSLREAA